MITERQINDMRTRLGSKSNGWSETGIEFLCQRTNPKGPQKEISMKIIESYINDELSQIPIPIRMEVAPHFGKTNLSDRAIAVILLGRAPNPDSHGRMQEEHSELTPSQDEAASLLVKHVSSLEGRKYTNRSRR